MTRSDPFCVFFRNWLISPGVPSCSILCKSSKNFMYWSWYFLVRAWQLFSPSFPSRSLAHRVCPAHSSLQLNSSLLSSWHRQLLMLLEVQLWTSILASKRPSTACDLVRSSVCWPGRDDRTTYGPWRLICMGRYIICMDARSIDVSAQSPLVLSVFSPYLVSSPSVQDCIFLLTFSSYSWSRKRPGLHPAEPEQPRHRESNQLWPIPHVESFCGRQSSCKERSTSCLCLIGLRISQSLSRACTLLIWYTGLFNRNVGKMKHISSKL